MRYGPNRSGAEWRAGQAPGARVYIAGADGYKYRPFRAGGAGAGEADKTTGVETC